MRAQESLHMPAGGSPEKVYQRFANGLYNTTIITVLIIGWVEEGMQKRQQYGVSEVVGTILVLGIITSSVTLTLVHYTPLIDEKKADISLNSALIQFGTMNKIIQDTVSQGVHCNRVYRFVTDQGTINIDSKGDRFIIYYSNDTDYDFTVAGLDDDNNEFTICQCSGWTAPQCTIDYLNGNFDNIGGQNQMDCTYYTNGKSYTISGTRFPLTGSVKIDIVNMGPGMPGIPPLHQVGCIWLFDAGSITFQSSSPSGTNRIIAENGAVIQTYPSGDGWLSREPVVFNQSNHFVLNMIQINGSTGSGGPGTYKFYLEVENRSLLVNNQPVYNFNIQVVGDHSDAWLNYFKNTYGFKIVGNTAQLSDRTPPTPPLQFTLVQARCNMVVGWGS